MKVRYLADENLNRYIVYGVRRSEPAVDFQGAHEYGLAGRTDAEVLRIVARDGRILVTHDHKTMPGEFGRFIEHEKSAGLLIVPQNLELGSAIGELLLVWTATEAEEWVNRIAALSL